MTSDLHPLPPCVAALAGAEFGAGSRALLLLHAALERDAYDREVALPLLRAARGLAETWAERRLAVLLLENQVLRLTPADLPEFDFLLVTLGLKDELGFAIPIHSHVLREGYSAVHLEGFVPELLARLRRLDRVHQSIRNADSVEVAWSYFLRSSRDDSKLTLARYVFGAAEVAEQIARSLGVSEGAEDTLSRSRKPPPIVDAPDYEAEILHRLCADRRIYWVSDGCGSELNALVEYPLTSAVVVVKPPGSDWEFEVKRAGTRGPRLLNVIRERNGKDAPTSHRLFGGSLGWLGTREASAAELFSRIYLLVHGKQSPCSRTVANSSIVTVGTPQGQVHLLDYLTDRAQFGDGFDEMRHSMEVCANTFPSDTGVARGSYQGERGLTLRFIAQALPQQAIIYGSSSFRLDRLTLYLSDDGPEHYYRAGLGREYTRRDARWLADSVLEEILGVVAVPPEGYSDYAQYVRDAFRVPQNRRRADANYGSVMRQIGECWGTLLAVRGFTDGESFVQRNVGLKSVWQDGEWRVRIIFMDHDDLTMAGSRYQYLWPAREVPGMMRDQVHILGGPLSGEIIPGSTGAVRGLYRVSPQVGDAGARALEDSLRDAYRKTQAELSTNPELQGLFYPQFIERFADLDRIVGGYLARDPSDAEAWKADAAAYLKRRHYDNDLIAESTQAIVQFRGFFERLRYLY